MKKNKSAVYVLATLLLVGCTPLIEKPGVTPPSADADLSALVLSAGAIDPAFVASTTAYSVTVDAATASTTITATTADSGATLTLNARVITSGTASGALALSVGDNPFTVAVLAADKKTTQVYEVTVTRLAPVVPSSDATLSALVASAGALSPIFSTSVLAYDIQVPAGVSSTTVSATASQTTATVTVAGASVTSGQASAAISLPFGDTAVAVVVTAPDGVTTQTYALTFHNPAPSSDATLTALALTAGALTPAFSSSTTSYSISVASSVSSTTLTATTAQTGATLTVAGSPASSGQPTAAIALATGGNPISVVVTAPDGATQKTYTITVTRVSQSSDSSLSSLSADSGSLSPAFASGTLVYTIDEVDSVTSVQLTPTATSPSIQGITVAGASVASGSASSAMTLGGPGTTTDVLIVVTAQDSTTTTYTVHVHVVGDDATLSALAVVDNTAATVTLDDDASPGSGFSSADADYHASLLTTATSVTLTPTTNDANATVVVSVAAVAVTPSSGNYLVPVPVGTMVTIDILVTAEDGSAQMDYSLVVTRPELSVLPDIVGFTDMHFVADDWSGSGDWTSRDANNWVATLSGAPLLQGSTQFPGRNEITGFSVNDYFVLAADPAHSLSGDRTYEIVVKMAAALDPGNYHQPFSFGTFTGVAGSATLWLPGSASALYGISYDAAGDSWLAGGASAASYLSDYVLVTFVVQAGADATVLYINGGPAGFTTTASYEAAGTARPGSIGVSWAPLDPTNAFNGTIVELLRHTEALDSTTVAARATQFNALKGY